MVFLRSHCASKGRYDAALKALARLRSADTDSPDVEREFAEIKAQCEELKALRAGMTWQSAVKLQFSPGNRKRLAWANYMAVAVIFSGANSVL